MDVSSGNSRITIANKMSRIQSVYSFRYFIVVHTLPFGGVGGSGVVAYHGKYSFDAFSHKKGSVLKKQMLESINK